MEPLELADRVLELVGTRAEAEVSVHRGTSALTRFANSFIHQNVAEERLAVGLRVVAEGRRAGASATQGDDETLGRLVERALAAARLRPVDPDWPGLASPAPAPDAGHHDPATASAPPDRRARVVQEFVEAGPEMRAAGFCETAGWDTAFANSAGQRVEGRMTSAALEGIHQTPSSAGSASQASTRLVDLEGSIAGERAAARARQAADAIDLEPGRYEVVLEPPCVATILSFLAYAGFNAKAHAEGRSFARLGEAQFDPAVSIWDDALDPRAIDVAFDAEGTPKRRVDLVRDGVTVGLAHDRRTAAKAGSESTGHALPGGEEFGAMPTDLFLGPGDRSRNDLIGSIERGLVVTELHYCRILDPKTQVVTGLTRNGTFLVEGGQLVGGVRDLRFTQSFVDALGPGAVLDIGEDARMTSSEIGGWFYVPSLRLASWNFTGGARG